MTTDDLETMQPIRQWNSIFNEPKEKKNEL